MSLGCLDICRGNGVNARPHPGPLPRGEGESIATLSEFCSPRCFRRPRSSRKKRHSLGAIPHGPKPGCGSPSPGGEGRGEGERCNNLTTAPYHEIINKEGEIIGVSDHLAQEIPPLLDLAANRKLDFLDVVSRAVGLDAAVISQTLDQLEGFGDDVRVVSQAKDGELSLAKK